MNSRKITASIVIDSSMNHVWSILTDYNNLAAHVPNLVQSKLVPSPSGTIRLFQEGAQKIIGFDFRASLFMDMKVLQPANEVDDVNGQDWRIAFACVQSRMFDKFDGEWILRPHSRVMSIDPVTRQSVAAFRTKLTYQVFVRPKGPVPVMALEWRIKEDIPVNLYAVKLASETISNRLKKEGGGNNKPATGGSSSSTTSQMSASTTPGIAIGANKSRGINLMNWSEDETLSQYINHKPASSPSPSSLLSNTKPMTTKDWIDGQQRLGSSFLPF